MRVTVERDELLTALHRVQGIGEKRNTMPSLANVLLEAKPEGLDISATDLGTRYARALQSHGRRTGIGDVPRKKAL